MDNVPLVIGGVLALFAVVFFTARNEIVKQRLKCPRSGEVADMLVKRRFETQRPLRVKSCNLLEDPTHVDCGQDCIKQKQAPG